MMPARKIIDFLGLKANLVAILAMVVLVGVGNRMGDRFLPIYLIALDAGPMAIGVLNSLTNFLSAIYSLIGGTLSDRIGAKRTLMLFNLLAIFGYVIVIAIPSWPAVLVGALFFLCWGAVSLPAAMGLIFQTLPEGKRTMGVTMHSMVNRVPMALGPILGGVMIDRWGEVDGIRAAFGAAILMALLSALIQQKLITPDSPDTTGLAKISFSSIRTSFKLSFRPELKNLLVADILVRFCEQIPYAFVVVWCMKIIESPVTSVQFGLLSAVEMATAMLIYVPVAVMADRGPKKPFVAMTFLFFALFPVTLYFCRSFETLIAAFALRGMKEFGEPTRKALIMELSPDKSKAGTFGLYYLIRDSIVSIAVIGGAVLWKIDPQINLFTATAFGLIATAWYVRKG